jgi:DNA gyrase subunit A
MIITRKGVLIRLPVSGISQLGRATQGVHLIRLEEEDEVAAVAHVASEESVGEALDDNGTAAEDDDTGPEADSPDDESGEGPTLEAPDGGRD